MISIFLTAVALIVAYYYLFYHGYDYFTKNGIFVKVVKLTPLFGSYWKTWNGLLFEWEIENYEKYGRVHGKFLGKTPNLIVAEPSLIKQVLVKDFEAFTNRRSFPISDLYLRRILSFLRDEDWKNVRSAITPVFTTGKIKKMLPLMNECADTLVTHLNESCDTSGKADMKRLFGAYTMDVIATCAFGMKIDSLADPENAFIKGATRAFNPPDATSPFFVLLFCLPWVMKLLRTKFFPEEFTNVFISAIKDVFNKRKENPEQKRNDFVDLMLEAIEEEKKSNSGHCVLDEETVLAQAFIFLIAGYETTATTLTITSHCLAKNSEVQEKLYEEICEKLETHSEVNHNMVGEMPYLEQCLNEALRLYPPAIRVEREVGQDTLVGDFPLKKGLTVSVPVFAIHHDPEFYPNPWKYDPERFSPEGKSKRDPYTYLPFGMGPRNCIGMRFALEEAKVALCRVLQKYRLTVCEETRDKPEFAPGFLQLIQPRSVVVGIERR